MTLSKNELSPNELIELCDAAFRVARSMNLTIEEAEDAAQDALLAYVAKASKVNANLGNKQAAATNSNHVDNPRGYTIRTTTYLSVSTIRKNVRRRSCLLTVKHCSKRSNGSAKSPQDDCASEDPTENSPPEPRYLSTAFRFRSEVDSTTDPALVVEELEKRETIRQALFSLAPTAIVSIGSRICKRPIKKLRQDFRNFFNALNYEPTYYSISKEIEAAQHIFRDLERSR